MTINGFLKFLKKTEKLKHTLRHAWTGDIKRQESTAEHTWHMSMMAIALGPYLKNKIDLMRVLKLVAVHDIGEAIVGDVPAFSQNHSDKYEIEEKAVLKIAESLPVASQKEVVDLYHEYQAKESKEALLVKMLDVIDVIFQHLVSDISTWSEEEFTFNLQKHSEKYFKEEPLMLKLYNEIHEKLEKKVKKAKLWKEKRICQAKRKN